MANMFCWKQEHQIIMLLNKMNDTGENLGDAEMTILQASDLPFVHIAGTTCANNWDLYQLKVTHRSGACILIYYS